MDRFECNLLNLKWKKKVVLNVNANCFMKVSRIEQNVGDASSDIVYIKTQMGGFYEHPSDIIVKASNKNE